MSQAFRFEQINPSSLRSSWDIPLISSIVLLLGIGLAVLFSASYFRAEQIAGDPYYFVRNQIISAIIGLIGALIASRLTENTIRRLIPFMVVISLLLMILTFIPGVGGQYLGARRWIALGGYTFQPSEFVKLTMILYLSSILSKKNLKDLFYSILPSLLVVVVFVGLIFLQNDFSTAFYLGVICIMIYFISGIGLHFFIAFSVIASALAVILTLSQVHRVERLINFLVPTRDPTGAGFQILSSKAALQNGGLFGLGIGQGVRKLGNLPEAQSDFPFAVLGEEMGFVGVILVMLIFAFFAYRGFRISWQSNSSFYRLMAFGITATIVFQALLNMSVVVGAVPATGIPLPFFSSGGSFLMITLILCGFLLNCSRNISSLKGEEDG